MTRLTPETAAQFMALTLSHLGRQYPYKMDLVLAGPEDARPPIAHHPIFHGSFDWHSCVHGWWQVLPLAAVLPAIAGAVLGADGLLVLAGSAAALASLGLLVVYALKGTSGSNRFGPDPLDDSGV